MKTFYKILILFAVIVLLVRCEKVKITPRDYPRLRTLPVTSITDTGAVFNAKIIYRGDFDILNYGFVWSDTQNEPIIETSDYVVYSKNIQDSQFSTNVSTTLAAGKRYIVRAFVQTKDYLVYGDTLSFLSLGSKASIVSGSEPTNGGYIFLKQVWEFDPSKPE